MCPGGTEHLSYTFQDAASVVTELINARIRSLPLSRSPPGMREGATEGRRPQTPSEAEGGPRSPVCHVASMLSLLPQLCGAWGLQVGAEGGGGSRQQVLCPARRRRPQRQAHGRGPEVSGWPWWPPVVTALSCKAACFGQGSATDARGCRCECKSSVPLRDIARCHTGSDPVNKVRRPR